MEIASYFRYWGKADPNYPGEPKWHPLTDHYPNMAVYFALEVVITHGTV